MKYCLIFIVFFCSACNIILFDNISDDTIELETPVDGVSVTSNRIEFFWEDLRGADSYRFQLITPSFDKGVEILQDTIIETTSFELVLPSVAQYQWRVCGVNEQFRTKYSIRTLTLINPSE